MDSLTERRHRFFPVLRSAERLLNRVLPLLCEEDLSEDGQIVLNQVIVIGRQLPEEEDLSVRLMIDYSVPVPGRISGRDAYFGTFLTDAAPVDYCCRLSDPENGVFQRGSETLTSLALLSITSPDPEWIALSPTHVCRGAEEAFLLDPEEYRAAE